MRFKLDENTEQDVLRLVLTEAFYPTSTSVLLIKDFLDKNFRKSEIDDINSEGYPTKAKTAVMVSNNGQPLKTFQPRELLLVLDDKFQKLISKKEDRRKFLKQVIVDWFNNTISKEGVLSVNHL